MALEFDEQLSRLEKPNRNEMTNKEYAVFNENVETMEKNWGFINNLFCRACASLHSNVFMLS